VLPDVGEYEPMPHGTHTPPINAQPAAHTVHCALVVEPVVPVVKPPGHEVHIVVPAALANEPTAQPMQPADPMADLYVPAGHATQASVLDPAVYPGMQPHDVEAVLPGGLVTEAPAQPTHTVAWETDE
jgi:hypothetical protein